LPFESINFFKKVGQRLLSGSSFGFKARLVVFLLFKFGDCSAISRVVVVLVTIVTPHVGPFMILRRLAYIIGNRFLINFNEHTVTWDTNTISMKDRDTTLYHQERALIEVYMRANEPQTLTNEYSQATKIIDAEYKPASLDDVIKTCENLYVEEQQQIKILLLKYDYLFDGALEEFKMEY
jgi:hypothetical protein